VYRDHPRHFRTVPRLPPFRLAEIRHPVTHAQRPKAVGRSLGSTLIFQSKIFSR
jgi:hypothetical protein